MVCEADVVVVAVLEGPDGNDPLVLLPESTNVVIEYPGIEALMIPPVSEEVMEVGFPPLDCWLTNAVTDEKDPPESATVTDCVDPAVFRTCTDTVPSVFLNALVKRLEDPLVVATRRAPGRTYRLHCAIAHKRAEGVTVDPEIDMRHELVVTPVSAPSQ